jgi:hypothetical protein
MLPFRRIKIQLSTSTPAARIKTAKLTHNRPQIEAWGTCMDSGSSVMQLAKILWFSGVSGQDSSVVGLWDKYRRSRLPEDAPLSNSFASRRQPVGDFWSFAPALRSKAPTSTSEFLDIS